MASPLGVGSGGGAEKLGEGAVKRVVQVAQREVEKKANKVFALLPYLAKVQERKDSLSSCSKEWWMKIRLIGLKLVSFDSKKMGLLPACSFICLPHACKVVPCWQG